jgi:hypothetical protein
MGKVIPINEGRPQCPYCKKRVDWLADVPKAKGQKLMDFLDALGRGEVETEDFVQACWSCAKKLVGWDDVSNAK